MIFTVQGRAAYAYTGGKSWGPGERCIVFIHGALHDHSVWTLLARWYAHHGVRALAVDLPAHGRSEGPPGDSIEALADWLVALLDAASVAQATLVGHSMGSLIALEAAARAPERVNGLVMIGTTFPMKVSPALLATAAERPLAAIDMVNAFSHSGTANKPSYPGPGAWLQGGNRALMRRMQAGWTGGNLFAHDFKVCDQYTGGLEAAAKVRCPRDLILGDKDAMTPLRSTDALTQALHARVHRLPAGHALMQEAPEGVLDALRTVVPA